MAGLGWRPPEASEKSARDRAMELRAHKVTAVIAGLVLFACVGETPVTISGDDEPVDCCPVDAVTIKRKPIFLVVGSTTNVDLEVTARDGSELDRSGHWRAEDSTIARLNKNKGPNTEVEGLRSGSTTVVAAVENLTDTADIFVTEPIFEDGFESGDVSHAENGFGWGNSVNMTIGADAARTGSHGLRLTYPSKPDGEDAIAQINLHFGEELKEVWVEYWMRVPENYLHRDQSGPTNNKFFQIWGGSRSDEDVAMIAEYNSTTAVTGGDSEESWLDWINSSMESESLAHKEIADPFIRVEDHGTWMRLRWHVKVTTIGQSDGVVEVWRGDSKIYSLTGQSDLRCTTENCNDLDTLRLLGWGNSGFDEATSFAFDDLKIYTQNPGW